MNDIETMSANSDVQRLDFNTPALQRKRRIRALKDNLARWYVSIGGLAVLGAITLIFFYLAQVVVPMFQGAELEARDAQQPAWLADAGEPLLLAMEEQNQVAMRLGSDGQVRFFSVQTGEPLRSIELPLPTDSRIVSVGQDTPGNRRFVLGLDNGQVLVAEHNYKISYPDGKKTITPQLDYPFGEAPMDLDPQGRPIAHAAISLNGKTLMVAGATDGALQALRISATENLLTGETSLEQERLELPQLSEPIKALRIDPRHMWLFAVSGRASVDVFDLRRKHLNGRYKLLNGKGEITTVASLLGGISLMVGDSAGGIGQWFMV
ncbi:MAG TPA: phosphate ABC transporter permease, partial [Pseudomonas sp.]|nr:phosphate ABC transporter permease [Pseudomonas sp.]